MQIGACMCIIMCNGSDLRDGTMHAHLHHKSNGNVQPCYMGLHQLDCVWLCSHLFKTHAVPLMKGTWLKAGNAQLLVPLQSVQISCKEPISGQSTCFIARAQVALAARRAWFMNLLPILPGDARE